MKIGIDIDGVILDFDQALRVKQEIYDVLILGRNSIVNEKETFFQAKYDWSEDEKNDFIQKEFIKTSKECDFKPGAVEVINMLKKDGHELIIISSRGDIIKEMKDVAEERLNKKGLKFDKYFWIAKDKAKICKEQNIDIMIDDYYKTCKSTSENNIKTLYFREYPTYELEENEYLKEVHNWGEIYRYIYEIGGNNAGYTKKY